jgi:tRNA 2-thiouridine synthesizing protein C
MSKKIACLLQHAPYGGSTAREGVEAAQLLAALEHQILLCFIGEGVWQLVREQQPEALGFKDHSKGLKALPLYDISPPLVLQQDLEQRGLTIEDLAISVECVTADELSTRIAACDFSWVF